MRLTDELLAGTSGFCFSPSEWPGADPFAVAIGDMVSGAE